MTSSWRRAVLDQTRRLSFFSGIRPYVAGPILPAELPSSAQQSWCVSCLFPRGQSSRSPQQKTQGCGRLCSSTSAISREPLFLSSTSVGLHGDYPLPFTRKHQTPADGEQDFLQRLRSCSKPQQLFKLVLSAETVSDIMAAAVLHRVADLQQEGDSLRDPSVLESDAIRAVCFQLEQDCLRLTDAGLVAALLACTRLNMDPSSTLMTCLLSESQARLKEGHMSVGQLCTLGKAALSMEGPESVMLQQVMSEIRRQKPAQWSLTELVDVYTLVQSFVGREREYNDFLNVMHNHALTVTYQLDPSSVSVLLNTLVILNQTQATSLLIDLCKQAVHHVPHFTDQELSCVLEALMHFGHGNLHFVKAMEKHVPTMAFTSNPGTVTKVVQFFARRQNLSPVVFNAVAESFVYRAEEYSSNQLAELIMAFGKLGYLPPNASQVFGKVEVILRTQFAAFPTQTMVNLLHACTLLERFPLNFVHKVFNDSFLQKLMDETTVNKRVVLATLTQLNMTMKLDCPHYKGPTLPSKYHIKSYCRSNINLETPVDWYLHKTVIHGLKDLLGDRSYFAFNVLIPYGYTLDVEIKLDEEGFVLPTRHTDKVHKRIALCIDGQKRFTTNTRQLLGVEAMKQRHLQLLGYKVVQIPFYELENLETIESLQEYLHQKIFPNTYRLKW